MALAPNRISPSILIASMKIILANDSITKFESSTKATYGGFSLEFSRFDILRAFLLNPRSIKLFCKGW
jgi:hypothetical protein